MIEKANIWTGSRMIPTYLRLMYSKCFPSGGGYCTVNVPSLSAEGRGIRKAAVEKPGNQAPTPLLRVTSTERISPPPFRPPLRYFNSNFRCCRQLPLYMRASHALAGTFPTSSDRAASLLVPATDATPSQSSTSFSRRAMRASKTLTIIHRSFVSGYRVLNFPDAG